jgi:hypothetical protein
MFGLPLGPPLFLGGIGVGREHVLARIQADDPQTQAFISDHPELRRCSRAACRHVRTTTRLHLY